jgi:hypothetical protein
MRAGRPPEETKKPPMGDERLFHKQEKYGTNNMPSNLSQNPAPAASSVDDVAAAIPKVPHDVLLAMAVSVITEHRRIVLAQQAQIEQLEAQLARAAAAWRPLDAVLQ